MALQVATTQDVTPETLRTEPSFRTNVESSIARGLGVSDSQVLVTQIQVDSRRLQADADDSAARRLKNVQLKVDYEVYMTGDQERDRIITTSTDSSFKQAFQKELRTKEEASGRSVVVDSIQVQSQSPVERTVSIEDAKQASKEKVEAEAAAASTTPSTTKKPTITSVTDGPSTTMVVSNSGTTDAISASASEIAPGVYLIALILLASCH